MANRRKKNQQKGEKRFFHAITIKKPRQAAVFGVPKEYYFLASAAGAAAGAAGAAAGASFFASST